MAGEMGAAAAGRQLGNLCNSSHDFSQQRLDFQYLHQINPVWFAERISRTKIQDLGLGAARYIILLNTSVPSVRNNLKNMTTSHPDEPDLVPPSGSNFLEVSSALGHEGAASTQSSFTRVDDMQPTASSLPSEPQQVEVLQTTPVAAVPQTPQVVLTFLLQSGKRRTMSFDYETTVGRVKELVWNGWPTGACRMLRYITTVNLS
jgi:hypothetical protein